MDMPLSLYKGHVTHIIDPSCFWMKLGTEIDFEDFEKYQSTLNQFYNQNEKNNIVKRGDLSEGDYVVVTDTVPSSVKRTSDSHWKRAQVARIEGDTVDVFYVDMGYTELVSMNQVRHINSRLFEYLPPQAVQSGVAGIRPLSRTWTKRATTTFESKVLNNDVLVHLVELEEEFGAYGKVVIYTRLEDGSWRSLIHYMMEEDVGLPTEDNFEEFLSEEMAKEALRRTETMQQQAYGQKETDETTGSTEAKEELSQGDGDDDEEEGNDEEEACSNDFVKPDMKKEHVTDQETLVKNQIPEPSALHLPTPADFLVPPQMQESTKIIPETKDVDVFSNDLSKVTITKFDVNQLKGFNSLTELMNSKDLEAQQQLRAQLEQDLEDCEDDESQFANDVEWVQSDLCIGEGHEFVDVHHNITQEIYRGYNRQSSESELEPFFKYAGPKKDSTKVLDEDRKTVGFDDKPARLEDAKTDVPQRIQKTVLPTKEEEIGVKEKIEKILTKTDEPDMLCALVNSVVEPDKTASCEDLIAVISAVLESLIPDQGIDPTVVLGILESYTATEQFEVAILTVLKKLKDVAVKLHSKLIETPETHSAFARVLAMLFIQAGNWPFSVCACVQEYAVASVERWIVFNKQRAQNLETSLKVELMYLECVEKFLDTARDVMVRQFPKRYLLLLEEIRFKLLHDATCREVRSQLLDLMLILHKKDGPMPWAGKKKQSNATTQTEIHSETETRRKKKRQDINEVNIGDQQAQSECDLATKNSLHQRNDAYKSSLPSDKDEKVGIPSSQNLSDISKSVFGDSLLSHHGATPSLSMLNQNMLEDNEEESLTITPSEDICNEQKSSEDEDKAVSSESASEKGGRQRGFPKTLLKMPPHIRKKFLEDEDIHDDDSSSLVKGNIDTELRIGAGHKKGLNPEAPEFRPPSAIQSVSADSIREIKNTVKNTPESLQTSESGASEKQTSVSDTNVAYTSRNAFVSEDKQKTDSLFFKPTDVESVKTQAKTIIKYTPEQLRLLDPFRLTPEKKLENITEPYDLKDIFPPASKKNLNKRLGASSPLLATTASQRYNTHQDLGLTESVPTNTKWKNLCDFLLPESRFKKGLATDHTSAHSEQSQSKTHESQRKDSQGSSEGELENLQKIEKSYLSHHDLFRENKPLAPYREDWHEGVRSNPELIEINKVEGQTGSAEKKENQRQQSETQSGGSSTNQAKKGKKKKTKFRPLNEVLMAKSAPRHKEEPVEHHHHRTYGVDEFGFDDESDEFDPYNLEELEQVGEREEKVIHPSRPVACFSSTSSRPSLFAHIPRGQQQLQPKAEMWVPGVRKCTRCGSKDHIIYDCPKQSVHNYEDESYMLL